MAHDPCNTDLVQFRANDTPSSPAIHEFHVAFYTFGWLYLVSCGFAFQFFKSVLKYERLRIRQSRLVWISVFGAVMAQNILPLGGVVGRANYPCLAQMLISLSVIPSLAGSLMAKLLIFFVQSRLQRLALLEEKREGRLAATVAAPKTVGERRSVVESNNASSDDVTASGENNNNNNNATPAPSSQHADASVMEDDDARVPSVLEFLVAMYRLLSRSSAYYNGGNNNNNNSSAAAASYDASDVDARRLEWNTLTFIKSKSFTVALFTVINIPSVVFAVVMLVTYPEFTSGCTGCKQGNLMVGFLVVQGGGIILFGALIAWRVRRNPDPWTLLGEVFAMLPGGAIGIIGLALQEYSYVLVVGPAGVYEHHILLEVGSWLLITAQTWGIVAFSWYTDVYEKAGFRLTLEDFTRGMGEEDDRHGPGSGSRAETSVFGGGPSGGGRKSEAATKPAKRAQGSTAPQKSGVVVVPAEITSLSQILADEMLYKLFEEHLVAELAIENLLFLKDARSWKEDFAGMNESTRTIRARRLVKLYVKQGARYQVNLPSAMSKALVKRFLETGGGTATVAQRGESKAEQLDRNVFDPAIREITRLLERGSLPRFIDKHKNDDKLRYASSVVPIGSVAEET